MIPDAGGQARPRTQPGVTGLDRRGRTRTARGVHNARDDGRTGLRMQGNDPTDDDAALFRAAIGRVRELPRAGEAPRAPRPGPAARMAERDEEDARGEFQRLLDGRDALQEGDALSYRHAAVPPQVLLRLSRGEYAVQDELDLRHAGPAQAGELLRKFLHDSRDAGATCVRIIHRGSTRPDAPGTGLADMVDRTLRQRSEVLAFHTAPPAQGGTGAVLVLLRRRQPRA